VNRRSRVGLSVVAASVLGIVPSWANVPVTAEETLRTLTVGTNGTFTVSSDGTPKLAHVVTVDEPGIRGPHYGIAGEVRYHGVQGLGYLEMWNILPQGEFFTRALAAAGPMKAISGSSDWRPFLLPFFNEPGAAPPTRLIVNIVLPGAGSVEVRALRLMQFADDQNPLAGGAWWDDSMGGLIGGSAGALLGCLGALIGWLSSRGRARVFVLSALALIAGTSVLLLLTGALAWMRAQPYEVYYPLLLVGLLGTVIPLGLLPAIRRQYQDVELRRMQALDLR